MRPSLSALLMAILLTFAGCLGSNDKDTDGKDDGQTPPTNGLDSDGDGYSDALEIEFGSDPNDPNSIPDLDLVPETRLLRTDAPLPGERTLEQVPEWRLGEWWKYRITDKFINSTIEVTRIVAGAEHGDYLVGFPLTQFSDDTMVLHIPGYGDIRKTDLAYEAHDWYFEPLNFPLEAGKSWNTRWQADNTLTVLVESTNNGTAELSFGGAAGGTATYNAEMGVITHMSVAGYAEYEVIDHGFGYAGDVRVPHDHDLVFFHGRLAGVGDLQHPLVPPTPAGPMETITVEGNYDRVSFAIIMADIAAQIAGAPTSTGVYAQQGVAPDGTAFTETLTAADMTHTKIKFFNHESPVGDWELTTAAAGAGLALFEGIAYHSIDVQLPAGCVLPTSQASHHANRCM